MRKRHYKKKDSVDSEELDKVFKKYHESVNMSYTELKDWSETEYSKLASEDRGPINRNLRLLSKKKNEWTNKDIKDANKTIAFISRMKKGEQGKPVKKGIPYSARDISLKNWAFDPNKRSDKIKKVGEKYIVLSENNRKFGEYNTEAEAVNRLKQIEHFKSKEDSKRRSDAVYRIDRLGLIHTDKTYEGQGLYVEPDDTTGFLRCKGRIARTGPQLYMDMDGNEWIEFRPEDEVFNPESMKSFEMVILTDEHPPEMVSVDNVEKYQKGYLGSNIRREGKYLIADIMITNKDLISKIQRGDKCELSNGYWTTVIDQEGVCPDTGTPYKKVQTDIFGNHCSVVEEARGGPECRLYTDAKNVAILKGDLNMEDMENKDEKVMLQGEEFEVPGAVANKFKELMAKVEEQAAELARLSAEGEDGGMDEMGIMEESMDQEKPEDKSKEKSLDALNAKIDMLQAQLRKSQNDSAKIDARINLVSTAKSVGLTTDGLSNTQIMKSFVAKTMPSMKGNLDGKSADYIKAAYDMALDSYHKNQDSNRELFSLVANADSAVKDKASSAFDSMRNKLYGRKEAN